MSTIFKGKIRTELVLDHWKVSTVKYCQAFYNLMKDKQMLDLMNDIKKNGQKEPGIIQIQRKGANVGVLLGEGNHRLAIAIKLNIPKMTIRFSY